MHVHIAHKQQALSLSLNLLPEDDKKRITSDITLYVVRDVLFLVLFVTLVVAILFIISKRTLDSNYQNILYAAKQAESQQPLFQQRVKELSSKSERLVRIQSIWQPVSSYVVSITAAINPPTTVTKVAIDFQKQTIEVAGHAYTRAEVLTIQKKLEQLPFTTSVDSPLTNILQSSNIDFQFTLHIRDAGNYQK